MNTRFYLKAIILSTSLVLTFMIAGLHVDGKAEANDVAVIKLQEIRHAVNPAPLFEEERHLARQDMAELEVIVEPVRDNSQKFSKTDSSSQARTPKKQIRATVNSIGTLASAETKPKELFENQDETEEKIIVSQQETSVRDAPVGGANNSREVPDLKKGRMEDGVSAEGVPQKQSTNSDAKEYVLDEIIVKDKTTTHSLRMEVIRAEELKYEIFNELNSTDDFDIICDWRRSTGSLLRDHYCVSGWMEKERRRDMDIWASGFDMVTPRSYSQLALAFADQYEALKKEMVDLALKHPELATAMLRVKELRYLLEKKEGKGRIKKKISTGLLEPIEENQVVNEFVLWQSIFVDHLKGSTPDDAWDRWDSWCRGKLQNKAYQALWAKADKDKYVDQFKEYVNSIIPRSK